MDRIAKRLREGKPMAMEWRKYSPLTGTDKTENPST
jgi:hypothetical protein